MTASEIEAAADHEGDAATHTYSVSVRNTNNPERKVIF
jgi:hypothetical protein